MPHVIFHLPGGRVVGEVQCQEENIDLAHNPATQLRIVTDAVPEAPMAQWRVTDDGRLVVVPAEE